VTNGQYVEFLNDKASAADPYGLWNSKMDPSQPEGAISRSGSTHYIYGVKPGFDNKPVTNVSWYEAARFVNWLSNGQGDGDTESGTYPMITGGGNNSGFVTVPDATQRAAWAAGNSVHWLLPSESEWYKAAYYNASAGTYWLYPFQSNEQPTAEAPPGGANSGNFSDAAYNYDGNRSYLTDVGAYPFSLSPYGAFDMGGDMFQWTDSLAYGSSYESRGGYYYFDPISAASWYRLGYAPPYGVADAGFRVASVGSVPEPRSLVLALIGIVGLSVVRKRLCAGIYSFAADRRASGG
jgi:formylglycine-generating enzyme